MARRLRRHSWGLHPSTQEVRGKRGNLARICDIQPFSQKSHTPTVLREFQIGLYDPTEADLEYCWNCGRSEKDNG